MCRPLQGVHRAGLHVVVARGRHGASTICGVSMCAWWAGEASEAKDAAVDSLAARAGLFRCSFDVGVKRKAYFFFLLVAVAAGTAFIHDSCFCVRHASPCGEASIDVSWSLHCVGVLAELFSRLFFFSLSVCVEGAGAHWVLAP
ncbi:uncharacterized protein Tco025E_08644 [Trypanosoma conorhini]|uniref:Uncharacterized protein n=1 Tax=Trypanosoma conorhini TaxID=83891 RepID=A0A3R7K3Q3_9TRYP|nr:uncharacterized protein Tco025E_08644 [Trypanosoma conorhini]RNF01181.1 hypothetical protein Tco025E_08644 [Trypanosoma conorhini]